MSRHAKNACSSSVFSHAERARLQYGTRERRGGLETQKIFDSCEICLHTAENPLICQSGHIFCRACIYESLAQQKETNKLLQIKYAEQQKQAALATESEQQKLKTKQMDMFEKLDAAVLKGNERGASSASSTSALHAAPAGYVPVTTSKGSGFIVDRELVTKLNEGTAHLAERKNILPAFWLPTMAPADVGEAKLQGPPANVCLCPGSNHPIKLKQLKPVRFNLGKMIEAESSTDSAPVLAASSTTTNPAAANRPMCFACKRQLHNQTPMICNVKCGHVMCSICVNSLMREKKSTTATSSNSSTTHSTPLTTIAPSPKLICLECDEPCKSEDLIPIVATTGFAATGNVVAKAKLTPAFQC